MQITNLYQVTQKIVAKQLLHYDFVSNESLGVENVTYYF